MKPAVNITYKAAWEEIILQEDWKKQNQWKEEVYPNSDNIK